MDTSDPAIVFDSRGVCNHCIRFDVARRSVWFPDDDGAKRLQRLCDRIKSYGQGKPYDRLIGLSGGVDSSYLAYWAHQAGLRPLALHVDAGWNSELAVHNIESLCRTLGIDLHTHVVNWNEMRDLQKAFFKSGVANQDVPQDHVFTASLFHFAARNNFRYILSGGNFASESILPTQWGYDAMDKRHLMSIHRRFGENALKTLPTIGFFRLRIYYPYLKRITVVRPLNYMHYDRNEAIATLTEATGWRYYGCKHGESLFTKFFQTCFLPKRFGYDKRRAHYSSLILAGQMTRDEALELLRMPPCEERECAELANYVAKKLGLTDGELEHYFTMPRKSFMDYESNYKLLAVARYLKNRGAKFFHFL